MQLTNSYNLQKSSIRNFKKVQKVERALNCILEFYNLKNKIDLQQITSFIILKKLEFEMQKNLQPKEQTLIQQYTNNPRRISINRKSKLFQKRQDLFKTKSKIAIQIKQNSIKVFVMKQTDFEKLNDWQFNEKLRVAWTILRLTNNIQRYNIPQDTLYRFLICIQMKYDKNNNPFHNFNHAISGKFNLIVYHCMYKIQTSINQPFLDQFDKFTLLISSLCHDVSHTGKTNGFQINSKGKYALRYNDQSPLQNHHAATTFKILEIEKFNILCNITDQQYYLIIRFTRFRMLCISSILFTDMSKHFELIDKISYMLKQYKQDCSKQEQNKNKKLDQKIISSFFLHACDLSSQTKQFYVAKQWSMKISQEFNNQVNEEIKLNLNVTQFLTGLDNIVNISKQEISFITVIIKPLWQKMSQFIEKKIIDKIMKNIEDNLQKWKQINQKKQQNVQNQ